MPAAPALQGLKLLVLEGPAQLGRDIGLVNRVCRDANALLVAGDVTFKLADVDRKALESLASSMDVLWPVVTISGDGATATLPPSGWWVDSSLRMAGHRPKPLVLTETIEAPLPAALIDPQDATRRSLIQIKHSRRCRAAVEALSERYETLRRQWRARRQKEERAEKALAEPATDSSARSQVDALRNFLQEEFAALQKGIQESNRKAALSEGGAGKTIEEALKTLQVTDLAQTPGHKTVQLTLGDAFQSHLTTVLRRAAKEQLSKDLVLIRDGLRAAEEQFGKSVEKTLGAALKTDFYPPDERTLRESLGEVLKLQVRYKGEMPKRSFIQRLSAGRRLLFAALMTLSLFIGLITGKSNARSLLAPFGVLFLVVFAGGVAWTYSSWKKEDLERLSKELEKVKEQLHTEALRLLGDVQREKLARLNDHLEQVKRDAVRRLDEFVRQVSQQSGVERNRERQAVRERIRLIDQRIKEFDSLRATLQKVDQDSNELRRECDNALRAACSAN